MFSGNVSITLAVNIWNPFDKSPSTVTTSGENELHLVPHDDRHFCLSSTSHKSKFLIKDSGPKKLASVT